MLAQVRNRIWLIFVAVLVSGTTFARAEQPVLPSGDARPAGGLEWHEGDGDRGDFRTSAGQRAGYAEIPLLGDLGLLPPEQEAAAGYIGRQWLVNQFALALSPPCEALVFTVKTLRLGIYLRLADVPADRAAASQKCRLQVDTFLRETVASQAAFQEAALSLAGLQQKQAMPDEQRIADAVVAIQTKPDSVFGFRTRRDTLDYTAVGYEQFVAWWRSLVARSVGSPETARVEAWHKQAIVPQQATAFREADFGARLRVVADTRRLRLRAIISVPHPSEAAIGKYEYRGGVFRLQGLRLTPEGVKMALYVYSKRSSAVPDWRVFLLTGEDTDAEIERVISEVMALNAHEKGAP